MKLPTAAAMLAVLVSVATAATTDPLPRRAVLGAAVSDSGGVHIDRIVPGSAAERAGLRAGDIVVSIAAERVATVAEFIARVKVQPTGRPVAFSILRAGSPQTLEVTLDPAPGEHDPAVRTLYESVTVDGSLRRTLVTLPKKASGRMPAVLILGGIGCFTIDAPADTEDGYMRLAHDLARRGIVAMRLEKSGVGDSQGPPCQSVDFRTELHSYAVALEALRRHDHVAADDVYLFGHSIGTLMAPQLAESGGVAGVVIAEGVGRNWFEYELANLRRQLELGGEDPAAIGSTLAEKELCMDQLLIERLPKRRSRRRGPPAGTTTPIPRPAPTCSRWPPSTSPSPGRCSHGHCSPSTGPAIS